MLGELRRTSMGLFESLAENFAKEKPDHGWRFPGDWGFDALTATELGATGHMMLKARRATSAQ